MTKVSLRAFLLEKSVFVYDDLTAWNDFDMRFRIPETIVGIVRHDNAGMRRNMFDLPGLVASQLHENFLGTGRFVQDGPACEKGKGERIEVEGEGVQQGIHVTLLE